jgi:hypothetical protein
MAGKSKTLPLRYGDIDGLFLVWKLVFVAGCCCVVAGFGVLWPGICQNQGFVAGVLPYSGICGRVIAKSGVFCQ